MSKLQSSPSAVRGFSRRKMIAGLGGAAAAGALFGRGGLAAAGRAAPGLGVRSGSLPEISWWMHEYGEVGVLEALERFAAEYAAADVSLEWVVGDYKSAVAAALLTDQGPDAFEHEMGATIDMIQAGQVVPLDGVLGDAAGDFNQRLIERFSFDGHLWAIPQVIDMHLIVYRKSLLDAAGIGVPETLDDLLAAAAALTTGDTKGIFLGNDGGVGVLAGSALWSAGTDYLDADGAFGGVNEGVYATFAKLAELFAGDSILLGGPDDWWSPSAFIQGLTAIQYTGLWTLPTINESEFADDYGVFAWPGADASAGRPSLALGAFGAAVSSKARDVDAAVEFQRALWVDNTAAQIEFAVDYGFHIPARASLAAAATPLQDGPAAEAVRLSQEHGFTQTPIVWSAAADTAYGDARARMIQQGADPETELAAVAAVVADELARIGDSSGVATTTSA